MCNNNKIVFEHKGANLLVLTAVHNENTEVFGQLNF